MMALSIEFHEYCPRDTETGQGPPGPATGIPPGQRAGGSAVYCGP